VDGASLLIKMCGGDLSKLDCTVLGEGARQGDAFALAEIERIARSFAIGAANTLTLLSADTFVIGGGVSNIGEILLGPIRRYADEYAFISTKGAYKIEQCKLKDSIVPIGAVLYACHLLS
jgi:glucokinase